MILVEALNLARDRKLFPSGGSPHGAKSTAAFDDARGKAMRRSTRAIHLRVSGRIARRSATIESPSPPAAATRLAMCNALRFPVSMRDALKKRAFGGE